MKVTLKTVKRDKKEKLKDNTIAEVYSAVLEGSANGISIKLTVKSEKKEDIDDIAGELRQEHTIELRNANKQIGDFSE